MADNKEKKRDWSKFFQTPAEASETALTVGEIKLGILMLIIFIICLFL